MEKQTNIPDSESSDFGKTRRNIQGLSSDISSLVDTITGKVDDLNKFAGTRMFDPKIVQEDIDMMKLRTGELTNFLKVSKSSYDKIEKAQHLLMSSSKILTEQVKKFNTVVLKDTGVKYTTLISNINKEIIKLNDTVGTSLFNTNTISGFANEVDDLKNTLGDLSKSNELTDDQITSINTILNVLDTTLETVNIKVEELTNKNTDLSESVRDLEGNITDMFDATTDLIGKIPLLGKLLHSSIGFDKIRSELKTKVGDILGSSLNTSKHKISTEALTKSFAQTAKSIFSVIGVIAKTLFLNPMILGITVSIGLLYGMWKTLTSIMNTSSDVAKSMGTSNENSRELGIQLQASESNLIKMNSSLESAVESAGALSEALKNSKFITANMATSMAKMSDWTGISKSTLASVYSQFNSISNATEQSAIASSRQLAAVASLEGLNADELFKDIESNSELIATHLSSMPNKINKTIVLTRRLGLSLSQVGNIAESVMDFENSIEKEFKASVLLGRQLNFNNARQKIFNNDIAGGIQDIMRQVGTLEKFNNLNMFQKKALAESIGLSTSELQKSLNYQKLLSKLYGGDIAKQQKAMDILEGRTSLDEKSVKQMVDYHNALDEIKSMFTSIYYAFKDALLPAGQEFSSWLNSPETKQSINSIVSGFISIAKLIGVIVGGFSKLGTFGGILLAAVTAVLPKLIAIATVKMVSNSPLGAMGTMGTMGKAGVAGTAAISAGVGSAIGGGGLSASLGGTLGSIAGGIIGSFFGPGIGTMVGSGIGGVAGGWLGGLFDKKDAVEDGILRGNVMYPISSSDDVMAAKPGGPIEKATTNSKSNGVLESKLDELIYLMKTIKFEVKLDGKKVGYGIASSQTMPQGGI